MPPRSRGFQHALDAMTHLSSAVRVCRSCRVVLSSRTYASLATAPASIESSSVDQVPGTGPATTTIPQLGIEVRAGIVLSRPPIVTPDPHPFETAYFLYQRRLNERLVLPFTQYFYFRRGTPAFDHWKTRRNERGGAAARDLGKYNAYNNEGWNDELLIGDETGQPQKIVEKLIEEEGRGEEFAAAGSDLKLGGLRRSTEADASNDQKSLERYLSRTLYLLVKNKRFSKDQPENVLWTFPSGPVHGKEGLKEAAQRILDDSCGRNMNTWFVGNHPVGHHIRNLKALEAAPSQKESSDPSIDEEKTFFMKARIMAGQADLTLGQMDIEDFRWLSKEEIQPVVSRGYWASIKNMLVDQ